MLSVQYDLFEDNTKIGILRQEIADVNRKTENIRKGIFFRHHELEKSIYELKDEIEKLKVMLMDNKKG